MDRYGWPQDDFQSLFCRSRSGTFLFPYPLRPLNHADSTLKDAAVKEDDTHTIGYYRNVTLPLSPGRTMFYEDILIHSAPTAPYFTNTTGTFLTDTFMMRN